MGRRGPRPQPRAKLKLINSGALRKPRHKTKEPTAAKGAPRCPSWLDDAGKAKWKEIVKRLLDMGVLTVADGDALAKYCDAWSGYLEARDFIKQHGAVYPIKDSQGNLKWMQVVPHVAIARSMSQLILRYQQEFGLTPSARTRVDTGGGQKVDDKFDTFLNLKKKA